MARRTRAAMAVAALTLAGATACSGSGPSAAPPGPSGLLTGTIRLVGHDSCDGLLDWFHQEGAARVGPYGLEGISSDGMFFERGVAQDAAGADTSSAAPEGAATPAPSSTEGTSTTNTQEPGIGEPDLAWTDGARVATVVNGALQVVDLGTEEVTATVAVGPDAGGVSAVGLLVEGDHALVIRTGWSYETSDVAGPARGPAGATADVARAAGTPVTVLSRYDLDAASLVGEITVDGSYVDARMVDGVVRTVVRSAPDDLGFVYPSGGSQTAIDRATSANRQVLAETTLGDWLPTMTVGTGDDVVTSAAVDCGAVEHPASFGGFDVVTVLGLDLAGGATEPLPSAAVVAGAGAVYSSREHLYVSTTRVPDLSWSGADTTQTTAPDAVDEITTELHSFSLPDDVAARYEASGSVPGTLLDQFAMSEHDGDLRVATTTVPGRSSGPLPVEPDGGIASRPVADPQVSESRVTVLRRQGDALAEVGRVVGLGPTEQIRGVRFAGPQAYVVTFRQTDPLYVVDLTDPTAPRVAGELKIDGYSSYLQVIGDGRVLGIGQDATDRGRALGFQESLFDVSDPADPTRLDQLVVEDGYSTAEEDHHALLWWAPEHLLAVPVESWSGATVDTQGQPGDDGTRPSSGVLVTRVTDAGIERVGTVTHPSQGADSGSGACPPGADCVAPEQWVAPTTIARTLVANGRLVTVSTAGVKVSDLATLADQAWIPLT